MKNMFNISNNVNLIINTYKCLFLQTTAENLRCCSTSSTMQHEPSRQRRNGKVLESAAFEIRKPQWRRNEKLVTSGLSYKCKL